MPLSVIETLLEKTLTGNYDDDLPWDAVNELRAIGTKEVFDKAASWCECPQPLVRARGLDILAQIGCTPETHEHAFPDESLKIISNLLDIEEKEQPISSAIYALGHIRNPISLPWIVEKAAHPSCDVRHAVAFALGSFPDDPKSIKTFISLMQDIDDDVRDWATFGLGVQGEADTPEIRDALWERINDSYEDARMEAFIGLGKRNDNRIIPMLLSVFSKDEVLQGYIEASELILRLDSADCQHWKLSDYVEKLRSLMNDTHLR